MNTLLDLWFEKYMTHFWFQINYDIWQKLILFVVQIRGIYAVFYTAFSNINNRTKFQYLMGLNYKKYANRKIVL